MLAVAGLALAALFGMAAWRFPAPPVGPGAGRCGCSGAFTT